MVARGTLIVEGVEALRLLRKAIEEAIDRAGESPPSVVESPPSVVPPLVVSPSLDVSPLDPP